MSINTNSFPLNLTRRQLLKAGGSLVVGGAFVAASVCVPAWAQDLPSAMKTDAFWSRPRTIQMRHASGERITATYWADGEYIDSAYRDLCVFMRDRRANSAIQMDPTLLDIVYAFNGWLEYFGLRPEIILNSGHRTAKNNSATEGSAKNSLHIFGKALDVAIPGVSTAQIARFGLWVGGGGVGWYPSKGFVHIDTGRIRVWAK
jgi:uncharacterized protein YcbK (DUF882 family)